MLNRVLLPDPPPVPRKAGAHSTKTIISEMAPSRSVREKAKKLKSIREKKKNKFGKSKWPLRKVITQPKRMQRKATETVRTQMESRRLICDRDAKIQLQKVDSFMASFCNSLDSIKAIVEETMQNQGQRKSGIAEFFTLL